MATWEEEATKTDNYIINMLADKLRNFHNRPYYSGNTIANIKTNTFGNKVAKNGQIVINPIYYSFKRYRKSKKIFRWKYNTGQVNREGKDLYRYSRWSYAYKVNYETGGFSRKRKFWVEQCINENLNEIKRLAKKTDFRGCVRSYKK